MSLGINTEDLVVGHELSSVLHVVCGPLFSCVQLVLMVLGLMLCITTLMDGGAQGYQCN